MSVSVSSKEQRTNLRVLAAISFLRGAHTSALNVIWQPFVLSLGASMTTVGFLASLNGMNGIVPTIAQSLGGWFADRVGRKVFIVLASLALIVAYALYTLAGVLGLWVLLLFGVFLLGASALSRPAASAITAESAHGGRHASAFSLMMVAWIVPGILAPTLGGWFTDQFGFVSIFPIFILLEVIALWLAVRYLHETHAGRAPIRWREAARAFIASMMPPPGLRAFFLATAGDSFSWALGWGLLNGMLTKSYGFSVEQLGIMSSIMSLAWAVMQMPIGRYVDKRGTKWMMVFSESIGIPLMLIGMTQNRFEIFAAAQILFALTAATWVPVVNTYLTRSVTAAQRSEAFGRLNMFRGLIAFPASWIGGVLYDHYGIQVPLAANLVGVCVVLAILIFFVQEPGTSKK